MFCLNQRLKTESLHIATLMVFAVCQPLFELLSEQTGFLLAKNAGFQEILLLSVLLVVFLPLSLVVLKESIGLISARLRNGLHLVYLAGLLTLLFLPILKRIAGLSDELILLFSIVCGIGITVAYCKKKALASFLTFLSPVILIFPILFLLFSKVTPLFLEKPAEYTNRKITAAMLKKTYPPVIFIIWDELPINTLLDDRGNIDAERYPNFANFASNADWYRNTNTVAGSTLWAVPAILSGQMPSEDPKPSPRQLASNAFTLLSKTHSLQNIVEEDSSICPSNLCKKKREFKIIFHIIRDLSYVYAHMVVPKRWESSLPDISGTWGDFAGAGKADIKKTDEKKTQPQKAATLLNNTDTTSGEKTGILAKAKHSLDFILDGLRLEGDKKWSPDHQRLIFEDFLDNMKPLTQGEKPPFYSIHLVFPHLPYNYLPSGKYYSIGPHRYTTIWQDERERYFDYQRHLLQVGATDVLMGQLLGRLKALGLYDKSLIIVTADHGASWGDVGTSRRELGWDNYQNIVPVPLFIKQPGQHKPQRFNQEVSSVDILPTIANMVKLPLPGETDGHSLVSGSYPLSKTMRVISHHGKGWYSFPFVTEAQKQALFQTKTAWFGTGNAMQIFTNPPVFKEFIGKPVKQLSLASKQNTEWTFTLSSPEQYDAIDLKGRFIPANIEGEIKRISNSSQDNIRNRFPKDVLIAINDVVWATYPYFTNKDNHLAFSAMVPSESFRQGKNTIRLFTVEGVDGTTRLVELRQK